MVKDAAETVVEVVEEAATFAEKVSSEVAEQLPEGGRLRTAAVLVEHASKEVAHEAHLAQDIIHKVLYSTRQCLLSFLAFWYGAPMFACWPLQIELGHYLLLWFYLEATSGLCLYVVACCLGTSLLKSLSTKISCMS